jgi:hydroxymethylglutaryl-CoA lyase
MENWKGKFDAAIDAGCRRFDGAILGFGGCPFAKNEMVGNIPTEYVLEYLKEKYSFDKIEVNKDLLSLALKTYNQ